MTDRRLPQWRGALFTVALALLAAHLTACGSTGAVAPAAERTFARTVDLSHVVREDMPIPAGEAGARLIRDESGALVQIQLGVGSGSLVRLIAAPGAPISSLEGLSPRDLVLPAIVIDARDRAQDGPGFLLSAADVRAWEQTYGLIPPGSLVLLATGWDLRWGDAGAYLATEPAPPGFGLDAAALLLDERGVAALGLDAPGQRLRPASGFRLLLENLTSVEQLPPTGATVVIGALKLQQAESSPARVLALVP
ncbi:MAG: cyclase family protein [Chloroflexi bacterium OHK40]